MFYLFMDTQTMNNLRATVERSQVRLQDKSFFSFESIFDVFLLGNSKHVSTVGLVACHANVPLFLHGHNYIIIQGYFSTTIQIFRNGLESVT